MLYWPFIFLFDYAVIKPDGAYAAWKSYAGDKVNRSWNIT